MVHVRIPHLSHVLRPHPPQYHPSFVTRVGPYQRSPSPSSSHPHPLPLLRTRESACRQRGWTKDPFELFKTALLGKQLHHCKFPCSFPPSCPSSSSFVCFIFVGVFFFYKTFKNSGRRRGGIRVREFVYNFHLNVVAVFNFLFFFNGIFFFTEYLNENNN